MMRTARPFLVFLLSFLLANGPFLQVASQRAWIPFTSSVAEAVEVDLQFLKGTQITQTQSGVPFPGGKVYIYDPATTNARTTYSDLLGTVANTVDGNGAIILDANGRFSESVYIPVGAWKIQFDTSADVTVFTEDNIEGALDTTALSVTFARPQEPVQIKTAAYSVVDGDLGTVINADGTGGAFTITLISAVTATDGKQITIRRTSATGTVSITTSASETINGSGSTLQLTAKDQVFRLVSDGANWHTITAGVLAPGSIVESDLNASVVGRLTPIGAVIAWPGTSAGGNTCPAGHEEADGTAISRTTFAELYALYSDSGANPGIYGDGDGSTTFNKPDYRGRFLRHIDGTAGLDPDKATRTDRGDGTTGNNVGTLQAEDFILHLHADGTLVWTQSTGTISGTAASAGAHTHPIVPTALQASGTAASAAGNSLGIAGATVTSSAGAHPHTVTGSATTTGTVTGSTANTGGAIGAETRPDNVYILYCVFASPSQAAGAFAAINTILTGPGVPSVSLGVDGDLFYDTTNFDLYTKAAGVWTLSTAIVGPTGIIFTFDVSIDTASDPGPGDIRLNNADATLATEIAVDDATAATGNPDISAFIATLDDSTSTIRGSLKIAERGKPENFVHYNVTGLTDQTGWTQLAIVHVDSSGSIPFADTDRLDFEFSRTGDLGAVGPTGPNLGLDYSWDTGTADADPGSGEIRANNATLSAATQLFIDDLDRNAVDHQAIINTFDDSTTTANRGILRLVDTADRSIFAEFSITGANVDPGGYTKIAVAHINSNGVLTDSTILGILFERTGDAGTLTGPGSSTDTAIARWNGTGGTALQDSGILIDGSDNITAVTSIAADGTGANTLPSGTTAQRPTPAAAQHRYNNSDNLTEFYNGTKWIQLGRVTTIQTFTAGGTWNKPANLLSVEVIVVGGGASGAGAGATTAGQSAAGGGGGAGGVSKAVVAESALGATETVTVGAGGSGVAGTAGNAGGTTSFGTHASATGGGVGSAGAGAAAHTVAAGGSGGVGSLGDVNINGGGGNFAYFNGGTNIAAGGAGGSNGHGGGGKGIVGANDGENGGNYGGGGSGASNSQSQSARPGGDGGGGIVIVIERY